MDLVLGSVFLVACTSATLWLNRPFSFSCMSLAAINKSLAPGCVDSREEDQNVIEESAAVGPAAVALGQTPSNLVSYLCSNQSE